MAKDVKVKIKDDKMVHNGDGGYYTKGETVEVSKDVADALKARKLAE